MTLLSTREEKLRPWYMSGIDNVHLVFSSRFGEWLEVVRLHAWVNVMLGNDSIPQMLNKSEKKRKKKIQMLNEMYWVGRQRTKNALGM